MKALYGTGTLTVNGSEIPCTSAIIETTFEQPALNKDMLPSGFEVSVDLELTGYGRQVIAQAVLDYLVEEYLLCR